LLLTDLPVRSRQEAAEKLDWYAHRWKIETFHKILKSGCRAEEAKLGASTLHHQFPALTAMNPL
jgi:hypothetical protein